MTEAAATYGHGAPDSTHARTLPQHGNNLVFWPKFSWGLSAFLAGPARFQKELLMHVGSD